ncbi:hypothetical protein NBRC116586_29900 [Pseudooceanicola nitratireducens]
MLQAQRRVMGQGKRGVRRGQGQVDALAGKGAGEQVEHPRLAEVTLSVGTAQIPCLGLQCSGWQGPGARRDRSDGGRIGKA